jgi:hypothetical protein
MDTTLEPRSQRLWTPPSRRAQVAGAVGIALLAAFWGLLFPFVNGQVEGSNPFKPGSPYDLGGATIVPAEGWTLGEAIPGVFTPIEKDGASLGIGAPVDSSGSPEAGLAALADVLRADTTIAWQIGEIETFTTDAGVPAGRVVSTSPDSVDVSYILDDGTRSISIGVRTDPATWASLESDIDTMARSMAFVAAAGEAAE